MDAAFFQKCHERLTINYEEVNEMKKESNVVRTVRKGECRLVLVFEGPFDDFLGLLKLLVKNGFIMFFLCILKSHVLCFSFVGDIYDMQIVNSLKNNGNCKTERFIGIFVVVFL